MPRRNLTKLFCDSAKPGEGEAQTDYFDEAASGLALRVSRGGRKAWTYNFTWAGKRARLTFGTYPATSLSTARSRADEARAALEAGKDPRLTVRKPETVRAICEEYFDGDGATLRTGEYRKATLERLVLPQLGDRPISEVRRSEISRVLDGIVNECGPVMADQTLAYLRRVFTWHEARSDDFRSPIVRGMSRTKPKERARERTLSDDEIRVIWKVADSQGVFGCLVKFILLTSARRTEAAAMRRSELSGVDWTLPAARNKTKVDLVRPLSKAALRSLPSPSGLKQTETDAAQQRPSAYVFSTDGENPVSGFSKFKRQFDNAAELEAGVPLPNWTLHDLRRTARSLMSRAGVSSDHAERCLGHVIAGVRGTYDRHDFYEEKQRAFEALADMLDRIVSMRENAVPMKAD